MRRASTTLKPGGTASATRRRFARQAGPRCAGSATRRAGRHGRGEPDNNYDPPAAEGALAEAEQRLNARNLLLKMGVEEGAWRASSSSGQACP